MVGISSQTSIDFSFAAVRSRFVGLSLALSLLLVASESIHAQSDFPYEATVSATNAVVHAAPSSHAYATDRLPRGTVIEVYRLDPGGWCAVRPPEGSFSLVPLDSLSPTDDPLVAQVVRDGAKAWVGTRIANREDPLWQVRLKAGEFVELMKPWDEIQAADGWAIVAPPAGEFRWIHERELQREAAPTSVVIADAPRAPQGLPQTPTPETPAEQMADSNSPRGSATESSPTIATISGTTPASSESNDENAAIASQDTSAAPPSTSASTTQPAPAAPLGTGGWRRVDEPLTGAAPEASTNASAQDNSAIATTPETFEQRLARAQRWFDQQLTGSPTVEPSKLKQELEDLTREARSSRERQMLTELSSRFKRWEDLELRRQALERLENRGPTTRPSTSMTASDGASENKPTNPVEASLASLNTLLGNEPAAENGSASFAAQGTLTRLIRDGGQRASSYAVQDSTGKVVALVVPGPGVNLERYLRKEVGVQGATNPNPTLNLPTVIADRVVELNRR